ncbi:MAG: DUF1127 domain-containing protein [Roseobacter sp.]|jgi:uncharacterized protein YjiS (DUF1127 family)|nr:DUF1127 domain-containing protein [Roseobacter sp.]
MAHAELHRTYALSSTRNMLAILKTRLDVWRSRRALAQLDARALEDIGISKADAISEVQRSFWDAPANWTRI